MFVGLDLCFGMNTPKLQVPTDFKVKETAFRKYLHPLESNGTGTNYWLGRAVARPQASSCHQDHGIGGSLHFGRS